ncbi:MAG TPA: hypothetical protein VG371_06730 [Solirubrobacteraceae bacterium]|nr:hypothetical protein [Solirubrobacteraceae bacterium]
MHWGGLIAGTDGEQMSLIIPIFCQPHHAPYLNSLLETRLGEFFGERGRAVAAGSRRADSSDRGSRYEQGHLVITDVTEPWPDGRELRELLEEAVATAGEIEAEQMRKARELTRHLRETGDRPDD